MFCNSVSNTVPLTLILSLFFLARMERCTVFWSIYKYFPTIFSEILHPLWFLLLSAADTILITRLYIPYCTVRNCFISCSVKYPPYQTWSKIKHMNLKKINILCYIQFLFCMINFLKKTIKL